MKILDWRSRLGASVQMEPGEQGEDANPDSSSIDLIQIIIHKNAADLDPET